MMYTTTQTMTDAIRHLQLLNDDDRKDIFKHIDLMLYKYEHTQQQTQKKRQAGTLAGQVVFAPDFDEPLDDFKEYL